MKIEFVKDSLHQFVIERKLVCKIHRFKRKAILEEVTDRCEASIDMTMTGSGCPVQYEGVINGKNAYYRDRHGSWYLEIYSDKIMDSEVIYRKEGASNDTIGYEGFLDAEKRIIKAAIKYAMKSKERTQG